MMINTNNLMNQQEIIGGLKAFDKPNKKGRYLATILYHNKALIKDIAAVALASTFDSANVKEVSLVLPTIFQFKRKQGSLLEKQKLDDFVKCVNDSLGHNHPRRLLAPRMFVDTPERPLSVPLRAEIEALSQIDDKIYFMANAIIANLKAGSMGFDQSFPCHLHDRSLGFSVAYIALETKFGNGNQVKDCVMSLDILLDEITGHDSLIKKDFLKDLKNVCNTKESLQQRTEEQPRTEETSNCIIA